jgi:hypothetical protein
MMHVSVNRVLGLRLDPKVSLLRGKMTSMGHTWVHRGGEKMI